MNQDIRVLHILHAFSAGGMENGIVNIINHSPENVQHEICLLTRGGEFLERVNRPVICRELHKSRGNSGRIVLELRRLIRSARPDIVHTRNWGAFDGVLAASFVPGIRLIHGEHGREMEDPEGRIRRRNVIRRLLGFRVLKFIAVSRDLQRWLQEDLRIPRRKIQLIPNGVDTSRFQPGRDSSLREELGIAANQVVVGHIGRLDPIKNHAGLVRAVHTLDRQGVEIRLVIVGDGPERSSLESMIAGMTFHHRPILTGYRNDVERFYKIFDLYVLNSHSEGMSNTLLEAMASGLPAVCTAVGGNVEIVQDGVSGKYVSVDDDPGLSRALLEYQRSPRFRTDHGQSARRRVVQEFSLEQMVQKYVELYRWSAAGGD